MYLFWESSQWKLVRGEDVEQDDDEDDDDVEEVEQDEESRFVSFSPACWMAPRKVDADVYQAIMPGNNF